MQIVVATIGLLGTVLAGGTVTELVKSRNARAHILTDLEILEKLPEMSFSRDKLAEAINNRVWATTETARWPGLLMVFTFWTVMSFLILLNNNVKPVRDDQGVLRLIGFGMNLQLVYAVYLYGFGLLVTMVIHLLLSDWIAKKTEARRERIAKETRKRLARPLVNNQALVEHARTVVAKGTASREQLAFCQALLDVADEDGVAGAAEAADEANATPTPEPITDVQPQAATKAEEPDTDNGPRTPA